MPGHMRQAVQAAASNEQTFTEGTVKVLLDDRSASGYYGDMAEANVCINVHIGMYRNVV